MSQQASASVAMPTQDLETLAVLSEIAVLESWLDHEMRCESSHSPSNFGRNDSGCSSEVTHVLNARCCGSILICRSRADCLAALVKDYPDLRCICGTLASEAWSIVPI